LPRRRAADKVDRTRIGRTVNRVRPRTVAKVTLGVLSIGGILATLWTTERPREPEPLPEARAAPPLENARAALRVLDFPDAGDEGSATIACDGDRRSATGFWADDPVDACEALASTQGALLAGPGCPRLRRARAAMLVSGHIGPRRFEHRAQRGGCPDADGWFAVNVLVTPLSPLPPDQELEEASR
jgi:hypothetical protein